MSMDGVACRGLTVNEGISIVGLRYRLGWPPLALWSGIGMVGAEEGSSADSGSRRRGSSLVRTKGKGEN